MKVLLTGGAGYIGSHTALDLISNGHEICIYDNLSNSSRSALDAIVQLSGVRPQFHEADVRDLRALDSTFLNFQPEAVIHFAGLKAVGESVEFPVAYYETNVGGTINVLKMMDKYKCPSIVFSSSATVYGTSSLPPFDEKAPVSPINPYGHSKLVSERLLSYWVSSKSSAMAICLRYFNPVGAHPTGLIGENPKGIPNNIMPYITRVAKKELDFLPIYGDDFDTRDGTGERDYIHVMDVAAGHRHVLENMSRLKKFDIFNLGTGNSTTVRELVSAFEEVTRQKIPTQIKPRRDGDAAISLADSTKFKKALGITSFRDLHSMCRDAWNWECKK